ncbi:MAG TPA: hypothetical protein DEG17_03250 [Cyanobacteria bacterium UBA11149]|nr:hypothetical protein [Cyanobacteria bacterium UBA11367]HBK66886.1 hypothetical protein [Cyanobacteria bacterium UBA11166]HBR77071.1 hypothetical protein [Cyanobacteria bacterium UBA11159]HBS69223.1 hypothetical protein [Cyanobacteria bacterium UBA11153]HBW87923.1 hypothetical protein [Cyanobacteria bacterium UBA11149]HCA95945.1 hypothetical protein [Cyanobacteria bacterium UBA9226]
MHIEFIVEEYSAKEFLQNILPKILNTNSTFDIHAYRGKTDLVSKLPSRLKGYKAWLPEDHLIVVLVDKDREDCLILKNKLEKIAIDAGLITKSSSGIGQTFQVINRIAIEELEAWFFGDIQAITAAYPGVSANLGTQAKYRNPDAIAGGTWEALERILQKAGYHQGGLEKNKAAREIARHMNPANNRSKSFQVFYHALLNW